ncbi:sensor histidine kinase [Nesterenkonia alba]|uniref:sensor histidine kinase n=1 Tax=Nesterenkonia alba TaxID=515814 RepID=UPI0003B63B0F|nr:sensor histidine kinase [Nesterenkonia alba]
MSTSARRPVPLPVGLRARRWMARHPMVVDALLAAAVMILISWLIHAERGGFRAPDTGAYLCAVALGALLLVRRRAPLVVLLLSVLTLAVYIAAGYPNIGIGLPLAAALYSAAERDRQHWSVTVSTTLVFLMFFSALATSFIRETDTNLFSVFIYNFAPDIALMAAVIALGDSVRARRDLALRSARLIEATAEHERSLAQTVAAEERTEIARELHDTLGHQATVVSMHAEVATAALPENPQAAERSLAVISDTSRHMMKELRHTVQTLRDHEVRRPELSVDMLRRTVLAGSSLDLQTDIRISPELDEDVEATAYRIVQEALTNVARHSQARAASVQITEEDGQVTIVVHDAGPRRTGTGNGTSGVGIVGMRERAAALGGQLEAGPEGDGFCVRAVLPSRRPVTSEAQKEPA